MEVLRRYQENDDIITEYTKDGVIMSHRMVQPIQEAIEFTPNTEPTQEEIQAQILLNTEYLAILSEISNM